MAKGKIEVVSFTVKIEVRTTEDEYKHFHLEKHRELVDGSWQWYLTLHDSHNEVARWTMDSETHAKAGTTERVRDAIAALCDGSGNSRKLSDLVASNKGTHPRVKVSDIDFERPLEAAFRSINVNPRTR